jgi:hypothetical protein
MLDTRLPDYDTVRTLSLRQKVWNALDPKVSRGVQDRRRGVRYLHATKGWKWVSKKRFAVRGVF